MNMVMEDISIDSVVSVVLPENVKQRTLAYSRAQCIREVKSVGFLLCLISVMLLSTGVSVSAVTVWTIVRKIPYALVTRMYLPMISEVLSFSSGLLGIPCFWITCILHNTNKNRAFLPLVITLFGLCVVILVVSGSIALAYKSELKSSVNSNFLYLNSTLIQSMSLYKRHTYEYKAWNFIQSNLKCCGSASYKDWKPFIDFIPKSCCLNENCENRIYSNGCARKITLDLMTSTSLTFGLTVILFFIYMFGLCVTSTMYINGSSNSST